MDGLKRKKTRYDTWEEKKGVRIKQVKEEKQRQKIKKQVGRNEGVGEKLIEKHRNKRVINNQTMIVGRGAVRKTA